MKYVGKKRKFSLSLERFLFVDISETNNSIKAVLSPKQKSITRNEKLITYLTLFGINQWNSDFWQFEWYQVAPK